MCVTDGGRGAHWFWVCKIMLGLKYSKCILLADSPIVIHMPTNEMMKGPVLWVVVHCKLVYNQEVCLDNSVDGSSKHPRNGTCVPIYRALYSRRLVLQNISPARLYTFMECWVLVLIYYTRWVWNKAMLSSFLNFFICTPAFVGLPTE